MNEFAANAPVWMCLTAPNFAGKTAANYTCSEPRKPRCAPASPEGYITPGQAAVKFGGTASTYSNAMSRGLIPHISVGRYRYLKPDDAKAYKDRTGLKRVRGRARA